MKVFLIGYMGVGKTSVGKRLAGKLKLPFFDTDDAISQLEGLSVAEIFSRKGEKYFREMESKVIRQLANASDDAVISTGGGAPCHGDNPDVMMKAGMLVWLRLPAKVIAARLQQGQSERPLIAHLSKDELIVFIENHLKEREPYYALAHIQADTQDLNAENLMNLVAEIQNYSR